MTKRERKQLNIMIIEDEQDILLLQPDVAIIDYKLPNNKNGIDAAIQILDKYPYAAILIVTAYETVKKEIAKRSLFDNKRVEVLIKPLRLAQLETSIVDIVNKK